MTRWFGPAPFAAACEPDRRMQTPVGTTCNYCEEPIEADDEGYAMPLLGVEGISELIQHAECQMVSINGHVRCILTHGPTGVCPHGADRDPPGMTKRKAAQLAEQLWHANRVGHLTPATRSALLDHYFPAEMRAN